MTPHPLGESEQGGVPVHGIPPAPPHMKPRDSHAGVRVVGEEGFQMEQQSSPQTGTQRDTRTRSRAFVKLTRRILDVVHDLGPNETDVFLELALLSRKPYSGDPSRGIPPTPAHEVGLVRNQEGRRLTCAHLSELCGVPRRKVGKVLDSLISRGLIERTEDDHIRVLSLPYLTEETDDQPNRFQKNEMEPHAASKGGNVGSASKGGNEVALKRGTFGEFLPRKEAQVASKGGGRCGAESLEDSEAECCATSAASASESETVRRPSLLEVATGSPVSEMTAGEVSPGSPGSTVEPPSGTETDMLCQPQRQFGGGAGINMTPEKVIVSRLLDWNRRVVDPPECCRQRAESDIVVVRRYLGELTTLSNDAGLNGDVMTKMISNRSAPPWSEDMLPAWKDIVRSMPFEQQKVFGRNAKLIEEIIRYGNRSGR